MWYSQQDDPELGLVIDGENTNKLQITQCDGSNSDPPCNGLTVYCPPYDPNTKQPRCFIPGNK